MNNSPKVDIVRECSYPTPYAASPWLPLLLFSLVHSQKHSPETKTKFKKRYNYIIVGAGSAGSVVARRLSEMPCVSVLLLEAGKSPPIVTDIPGIARSFFNTDLDWQFETTPQRYTAAGLINRRVPWPSGKALGGSSIFNGMVYDRGNKLNYDEWERLGAKGWSYKDVLPYFKKLENNTDPEYVASGFHATGGPITASRPEYSDEIKLALIDAIEDEGFIFVNSNGADQLGFSDHQATIKDGQRSSTAKGYLVPIENRTNVDIVPGAMVRKVTIKNRRATGVEFDFDGSTHHVRATREVILSAGTTKTAQLLMLSGIGPMSELMKLKIPLVADLPVGLNFQDHPLTFLTYEVNDTLPRFGDEIRLESNILKYLSNRTGPLASNQGIKLLSYLSNSNSNNKDIPDHTVYFADFAPVVYTQLGWTNELLEKIGLPLVNKTIVMCGSQLLHSYSIGSVSLESSDPYAPPVIDPNYLADFRDIEDIVGGLRKCQRIMKNPAMQRLGAKPVDILIPGCEEFANDEDLYMRCIARTVVESMSHPVGTAKMGDPNDPTTVVDPELRVKGVRRLRVVDASIMATVPWSNTNIPTIMVAEKASDIIKKTIKCKKSNAP